MIGVFDIVGAIASGWLTDRYDPRWLLFWYYGLRGLVAARAERRAADAGLGLVAFVVFYGLDWVATVPPTVALCREVVRAASAGVVFAWVFAPTSRRGRSPPGARASAARWFDSYLPAFLFAGALGIAGAVVSLLVGRRIVRPLFA